MANTLQNIVDAVVDFINAGGYSSGSAKAQTSGGSSSAPSAAKGSAKATTYSYTGSTSNSTTNKANTSASSNTSTDSGYGTVNEHAAQQALEEFAKQSAIEKARNIVDETPAKSYGYDALNAEVKAAQDKAKNAEINYAATLEQSGYNAGAPEVKSAQEVLDNALREAKIYTAAAEKAGVDRVAETVKGAAKQYAGGMVDAAGAAYEGGVRGASAQRERELADLEQRMQKAEEMYKEAAEKYGVEDANAKAAAAYLKYIQDEANAYKGIKDDSLYDVADSIYGQADKLTASGVENISKAKEGLGKVGQFAVDVGVAGTQVLLDAVTGKAVGGSTIPLAARVFGGSAAEARADGANATEQGLYGVGKAALEVVLKKVTGGLAGIYGKGMADDLAEKVVAKLAKSDLGRTALRSLLSATGEGAEELASAAISPVLKMIYNEQNLGETYSEEEILEWLYDALVGFALGGAGAGVSIVSGQDAAKNTALRKTGEDILLETINKGQIKEAPPKPVEPTQQDRDYLNEVLGRGRINNTAANNIINSPGMTAAFNAMFPQTPLEGTTVQKREIIREAAKAHNAVNAEAQAAIDQSVKELEQMEYYTPGGGFDTDTHNAVFVRNAVMGNVNVQTANEINNNPELRAIWEGMTGKTLPANPKSAVKMIMQTQRKSVDSYEAPVPVAQKAVAPVKPIIPFQTEATQSAPPAKTAQAPESAVNAPTVRSSENIPAPTQNTENEPQSELNNPIEQTTAEATQGRGPERERAGSENARTNPGVEEDLRNYFNENPEVYTQLTNKEVKAKADAILAKGYETARQEILDAVYNAKHGAKLRPEYAVASQAVANEMTRRGERETAIALTADIAAELTAAGQLGQIGRLLRLTNPQTVERAIQKCLDKVTAEAKKRGFDYKAVLTDADIALINKTDFNQDGAYDAVYEQIAKRVGKEMPSTLWDKLKEVRRINMLLRPRTIVKNTLSNAPMAGARKLSEALSAHLQTALVKSGKMDAAGQTRAVATKAERELAREYWNSHKEQIMRQGDKWDFNSILRENRAIFKDTLLKDTKIGAAVSKMTGKEIESFGEALRQTTYHLLESGDTPFVRSAFVDSLAQYCAAQGITTDAEITSAAIDFATFNAMEATFKNANVIADALNKIKRESPSWGVALDVLMPFTTTPANILHLMGEYSPVGIVKAAFSKESAAARVDAFSKGAVGSAIMLLGFALRKAGAISGGEDEDKDKAALDKATGMGKYSFFGKVSYDWAQPAGSLLALGAEIADALEGEQSWGNAAMNALYVAGDSVLYMSMFQNILSVLKGTGKPTQQILDALLEGGASQMMPGLIGDIAKVIDDTARSTYTGGNVFDNIGAKLSSNIPGLSKTLPESVNVKGEAITKGNFGERALNQFVNPSTVTKGERSEADKEIYRLFEVTGSKTHFPSVSPYKFEYGSETYKLNGEERAQFQKTQGQAYYALLEQAIESKHYEALNDNQKQELLNQFREQALADAKAELVTARGKDYEENTVTELEHPADYMAAKLKLTDEAKSNDKTFDATSNAGFAAFAEAGLDADDLDILAPDALGKKLPAYEAMRDAGYEPVDYTNALEQMDENDNGNFSQAEVYAYLSQDEKLDDEAKQQIWETLIPNTKTAYADYNSKKSGGGGYGGGYGGGKAKSANLGNSVNAVRSIANSGTTSNSSKYMRQALNDVIAQNKKQQATQPTVKWEDLLAGYVKGIK